MCEMMEHIQESCGLPSNPSFEGYYVYSRFPFIHKIKRFKRVGTSLKKLFQGTDLNWLAEFLTEEKQKLGEEDLLGKSGRTWTGCTNLWSISEVWRCSADWDVPV